MHLPLDIFLALRYLRPKRTFVSFITLLSILGPTLGVAILLIVNSIMAGFGKDIQENIMSWQAHLHVFPNMKSTMDEPDKIIEILEKIPPSYKSRRARCPAKKSKSSNRRSSMASIPPAKEK